VRWGFLGAGFVASRALAPAVHASPEAQLRVVAARDPVRAAALEPRARSTDNYEDVLRDDQVEAVYISLTNETHLRWITEALKAGKHVLCEKPITLDARECREAFAAAAAADRLLVEAAWTQWHPRSRRAEALMANGDLGPTRSIDAIFTFDGVPDDNYRLDVSRGGGALLDVGPYLLRLAAQWEPGSWTVESVERRVSATRTDLRTSARLAAVDGAHANVVASFVDPEQQHLTVRGAALSLTWGPPAFTTWRDAATLELSDGERSWTESFPVCDAYQLMVAAVSRRIRGDADVYVVDEVETLRCMELIDLVSSAAAEDTGATGATR
jgi:predicted dehydrogenase